MATSPTVQKERVTTNTDLIRERNGVSFDPENLTKILYGEEKLKRKRYIENIALSCKEFDGPYYGFLPPEKRYGESVRQEALMAKKLKELNITDSHDVNIFSDTALTMDGSALSLHRLAFVPPIMSQASEEQIAKWKPKIDTYEMLGSYAQTELGHGSNVRALETTAEYDVSTQEFVLNTPNLTSIKWWPGNLAKTSNHTLVLAQLITKGIKQGIHAFLVPVRDMHTHMPLPGITVGEIGPAYGIGATDNGFLVLKNVRIPRDNLLMGFSKVLPDGTYIKPKTQRVTYAGMLTIRCGIPGAVANLLARGATIATRYSLVRRQSEMRPGAPEPQVLDYQTQQYKVLPAIAMSYAMWFVGDWLMDRFRQFREDMKNNKFDLMLPLHVASSCCKGYTTAEASDVLETCRLACGGHGYSLASGFHKLFAGCAGMITAEGEATVLHLQAARYLMKAGMNLAQGKSLEPTVAYIEHGTSGSFQYHGEVDLPNLLRAFQYKSTRCIEKAGSRIQKLVSQGMDMHDAMNNASVYLVAASKAHAEVLILQAFKEKLEALKGHDMAQRLGLLAGIYALYLIDKNPGSFIENNWMSTGQLECLREKLLQLLERMRPDAIAYVDAFDFLDRHLESQLGRYDGDVYENMFKWAKSAPLNQTEVHESFYKYLKPLRQEAKAKL